MSIKTKSSPRSSNPCLSRYCLQNLWWTRQLNGSISLYFGTSASKSDIVQIRAHNIARPDSRVFFRRGSDQASLCHELANILQLRQCCCPCRQRWTHVCCHHTRRCGWQSEQDHHPKTQHGGQLRILSGGRWWGGVLGGRGRKAGTSATIEMNVWDGHKPRLGLVLDLRVHCASITSGRLSTATESILQCNTQNAYHYTCRFTVQMWWKEWARVSLSFGISACLVFVSHFEYLNIWMILKMYISWLVDPPHQG